MIRVSVKPGTLVAGQRSTLTIELSNTGPGPCSDVVFRLKLPPGMALVSGRDRIDVKEIQAQQDHVHQVTVLPAQPGDVEVCTSNFSYRDEDGGKRSQHDWRAPIRVRTPGGGQDRPPSSPPRLTVSQGESKLAHDEWDDLEIFLRNAGEVPLYDVTLALEGPFRVDHASRRIGQLRGGGTGRAVFKVHVPDRGKVPASLHTTYRYQDERGQVRLGEQDAPLTVEVAAPGPVPAAQHNDAPVTTILYAVSQPLKAPVLSSYHEMREVEKELKLGPDEERFLMVHRVAASLRDLSRDLGYYKPQIVHFSGHGLADGRLAFEDSSGGMALANPAGLASLLAEFAESVKCVIVNACYSLALAEFVVEHIDYVVGMRSKILDSASVEFSVGFYQGLFAGKTVPAAFRQGVALVEAQTATSSASKVPRLLTRRST